MWVWVASSNFTILTGWQRYFQQRFLMCTTCTRVFLSSMVLVQEILSTTSEYSHKRIKRIKLTNLRISESCISSGHFTSHHHQYLNPLHVLFQFSFMKIHHNQNLNSFHVLFQFSFIKFHRVKAMNQAWSTCQSWMPYSLIYSTSMFIALPSNKWQTSTTYMCTEQSSFGDMSDSLMCQDRTEQGGEEIN